MKKTNAFVKNSDLVSTLDKHFKGNTNKARLKLMAHLICGLCKVRSVCFNRLSESFETTATVPSSLRRIQRFFAEYILDSDLVSKLVFSLLPQQTDLILSIDRTNWKFGRLDINIFMLGIAYRGVAFPLMFTILEKRGNSNTTERIKLIERFIMLFGTSCIKCLVADREFVGEKWLGYLNDNNIRYHIRIRNNFKVYQCSKNKEIKASLLFSDLKKGEFRTYHKIMKIKGQYCYLSGCKLASNDYLIIVSFNKPAEAQADYRERWQIEMCFKAMKSSGFDLEKTHLNKIERIERLVQILMIAFVWCYKAGIYLHEEIKAIKIKKHGRKAMSIFRYGLNYISNTLLNPLKKSNIDLIQFLSCT